MGGSAAHTPTRPRYTETTGVCKQLGVVVAAAERVLPSTATPNIVEHSRLTNRFGPRNVPGNVLTHNWRGPWL